MRTKTFIVIAALLSGVPAYAQTDAVTTNLLVVGSTDPTSAPSGSALMRIISNPTIGSASGTLRPVVFDANGNVFTDNVNAIDTSGVWTFGTSAGAGRVNLNGAAGSLKGIWFQDAGSDVGALAVQSGNTIFDVPGTLSVRVPGGTPTRLEVEIDGDTNVYGAMLARGGGANLGVTGFPLGFNNVRVGNNVSPRIVFEHAGYAPMLMDTYLGDWRLIRLDTNGLSNPISVGDNVIFQPYGKRLLPGVPYGVDIGSQQSKFGAGWFGELIADTLVTIENIGTIDNRWLIGSGNMLDADLSPSATSMITRYNNFAVGHYVYAQKFGKTEFFKVTAGPTLYNGISSNASLESGTVTNWQVSVSDTVTNSTTKSYHGERSMFVDANGAGGLQVAYAGFASAASTVYTSCAFFRRSDGGVIAHGDITVKSRDGTAVALTSEPTGTDAWYRGCATFTSGVSGDTRAPFWNFVVETDYYVDAIQIEGDATVRTFSETRSAYTITRNEDSIGVANQWYAGDGLFSTGGAAGYGWIDCYAFQGIKSATEQGPACAANVRTGTSVFAWEPNAAWGNLNGLYHYGVTTFGFAAGPQSGAHQTIDNVVGTRFWEGTTEKARFDLATGNIQIGEFIANRPVLLLTSSALQFCVYGGACTFSVNGTTGSMSLAGDLTVGTAGSIRSGATAYDTGTGYWLDYNGGTPRMRIGTTSAGTSYLRWTGSDLEVKSNTVSINSSGITIAAAASGAYSAQSGVTWTSSAIALHQLGLTGGANAGGTALFLNAINSAGQPSSITLTVGNNGATGPNQGIFMSTTAWITTIPAHTVNGTATAHGTYSCLSAGQAVRSINVERGYVMGVVCGTP